MHYFFYLIGVVLLCVPGAVLARRRHRFATIEQISEHRHLWWSWVHALNLVDVLRGYTGVLFLSHAFAVAAGGSDAGVLEAGLIGGACLAGALVQPFFYRLEARLVVPVAYMGGLAFALLPPHVAGVALALGVATAIATRHIAWGLATAGVTVAVMGALFRVPHIDLGVVAGMLVLSVVMQDVLHRRLVLVVYGRRESERVRVEEHPAGAWR